MPKLTPKQARFVQEYLCDLNATRSAIRSGYSSRRASEIGHQLLQRTTVATAIQRAMQKREKRTEITQDRVLAQIAKIAFADLKDFVEWDGDRINIKPSDDVDGTLLSEISENVSDLGGRTIKIRRHDAMKALELLGRHLGMFNDKLRVDMQAQVTFVDDLRE